MTKLRRVCLLALMLEEEERKASKHFNRTLHLCLTHFVLEVLSVLCPDCLSSILDT